MKRHGGSGGGGGVRACFSLGCPAAFPRPRVPVRSILEDALISASPRRVVERERGNFLALPCAAAAYEWRDYINSRVLYGRTIKGHSLIR